MFSKYSEISKVISDYVNESLLKPMADVSTLNQTLQSQFGFSLSDADLLDLKNKIDFAKRTRSDYQAGVNNKYRSVTDWNNALDKAKEIAEKREGEARSFAFTLSKKICIGAYKGPLTLDTMRELKENGYDGTYGSTTMIQMYALYNQNQKLEEDTKQKDAIIVSRNQQIAQYDAQYRELFIKSQNSEVAVSSLKEENAHLKNHLNEQNKLIQSLSEKIDNLSKKLSTQIMDMLRGILHQPTYSQGSDEDVRPKTM